MLAALVSVALLSLSTSAAPWSPTWSGSRGYPSGSSSSSGPQVPFQFPLQNGFPNIQIPSAALTAIQKQAHGTLPNGPLPSSLTDLSALTLQAVAFGELFEVAYFTALINNITASVPGFELGTGAVRQVVLNALSAVQAQEELHALGVNAILSTAGRTPVQPCQYTFPVDSFDNAIEGASIFTDLVVLGGLQDAINTFATDGDTAVVPLFVSIEGQEGEQNGFYRSLEGNIPSALPFLTRSAGPFGFSFVNQYFVVPGTCPTPINIPIFGKLNVLTPRSINGLGSVLQPRNQRVNFSFTKNSITTTDNLHLVLINQQNTPIVESLQNVQTRGNDVTFSANFPYQKNLMDGLTIAVVTNGAGPFTSVDAVANATLFGPGVIEIL